MDALANVFFKAIFVVKFRVCEHDILPALEKVVMVDLTEGMWSFVL